MDTPTDNDPARSGDTTRSGRLEASASEDDSQEADGRDSGIVEVEGKASTVAGGVTSALANTLTSVTSGVIKARVEHGRNHDIEIDTDLGGHAPRPQMITQTVPTGSAASVAAADEDEMLVSDEEIESADPGRPTLTSGLPAFGRSLPPAGPSRTSLPPPRRSSRAGALLGSSLPPPSFPSYAPSARSASGAPRAPGSERDPWILANKTLELSRAHSRISVLEDQIAFRDARILSLEERLEAAQLKVEELERKLDVPAGNAPTVKGTRAVPKPAAVAAPQTPAAAVTSPVATAARPTSKHSISIPKPADVARSTETNKPAESKSSPVAAPAPAESRATAQAAVTQAAVVETADADGPEVDGGSILAEADEDLAAVAAPSGPEDVRRIAGIGVRFEAALRKQGVTRVSQIAAWSDSDVRQMAKALKIPKSRIVKGRWVEAAREMIGSRSTSE